ncbi:MAG: hypothetical protein Q8O84_04265, partial [Nanoarchaeota archaeon]|nr:hypothetical protein [Nanoarchaeota archaeon]
YIDSMMRRFFDLEKNPVYQQTRKIAEEQPIDEEAEDVLVYNLFGKFQNLLSSKDLKNSPEPFLLKLEHEVKNEGTFRDYFKKRISSFIFQRAEEIEKEIFEIENPNKKAHSLAQELAEGYKVFSNNKQDFAALMSRSKTVVDEDKFEKFKNVWQEKISAKFKEEYKSLFKKTKNLEKNLERKLETLPASKVLGSNYYSLIAKEVRQKLINEGAVSTRIELDEVSNEEELADYLYYLTTRLPAVKTKQTVIEGVIGLVDNYFAVPTLEDKKISVSETRKLVEAQIKDLAKRAVDQEIHAIQAMFRQNYFLDAVVDLENIDLCMNTFVENIFASAKQNAEAHAKYKIEVANNQIKDFF